MWSNKIYITRKYDIMIAINLISYLSLSDVHEELVFVQLTLPVNGVETHLLIAL